MNTKVLISLLALSKLEVVFEYTVAKRDRECLLCYTDAHLPVYRSILLCGMNEKKKKAMLLSATSLVYNPCTFVWRCIKKLCLLILFRGGVAQLLGAILGSGADLVFTLRLLFALLLCYLPLRNGQSLSVMPELLLTAPRKCTKERIGRASLHWSYSK